MQNTAEETQREEAKVQPTPTFEQIAAAVPLPHLQADASDSTNDLGPPSSNYRNKRQRAAGQALRALEKKKKKVTLESCSKQPCPHGLHGYDVETIQNVRLYFNRMPAVDQRCWFSDRRLKEGTSEKKPFVYYLERPNLLKERLLSWRLEGHCSYIQKPVVHRECVQVCKAFLIHVTGKSSNFFDQPGHRSLDIVLDPERQQRRIPKNAPKTAQVEDWLRIEAKIACCMPQSNYVVLSYRTKSEAHAAYILSMERSRECAWVDAATEQYFKQQQLHDDLETGDIEDDEMQLLESIPRKDARYGNKMLGRKMTIEQDPSLAHLSTFLTIWNSNKQLRESIKVRVWMPFAKCDTCSAIREQIHQTRDQATKLNLRKKLQPHLSHVKRERCAYECNIQRAKNSSGRYLSLIIDGADAHRFSIPHFAVKSHASDASWKCKIYILGCIAHGHAPYIYLVPSNVAQGHNITIQVLYETVLQIRRTKGKVPPVLYLQLDNTTKQNKGAPLMVFLAHLVQIGVFEKIYVSFLPVGHTHTDVDQMFSRISVYLRTHNALTRECMMQHIRRSFQKNGYHPVVKGWDRVANISEYFLAANYYKPNVTFKDITLYHNFRILRRATGQVVVQARSWCGSNKETDFWRGFQPNTSEVTVFESSSPDMCPNLLRDYSRVPPSASPEHITKNGLEAFHEAQQKKKDSISMLFEMFPALFNDTRKECLLKYLSIDGTEPSTLSFDWDKDDLAMLYNSGQKRSAKDDIEDEALDIDVHGNNDETGQYQPQLCVLRAGDFYITRTNAALDEEQTRNEEQDAEEVPFLLCRIKFVEERDGVLGGRVQWWDISTQPGDRDYVTDPYHCNGHCPDGTRRTDLDFLPQTDFQDYVKMVKHQPNQCTKELIIDRSSSSSRGIERKRIHNHDRKKVRAYVHRFQCEVAENQEHYDDKCNS